MPNFRQPDKSVSRSFVSNGVYIGVVTRVDNVAQQVYVEIPRFVAGFEFGPLNVACSDLPVVGEKVACSFLENSQNDIMVIGVIKDSDSDVSVTPVVATSTTRPVSPRVGAIVYETDTEGIYVWSGTAWLSFFEVNLPVTIYADLQGTAASATFASTAASATFASTAASATIASSVADNSVVLGDDTTGNYVATVTAGTGVSISAGAGTGEGSTPTLAIGQSVATTATPSFSTITSTVDTGTAPLTVTSTTLVTNLNADRLDGQHGAYYENQYQYLTTTQRNALTPTKGMTVYDTDLGRLLVYYGATTGWQLPWNQPWGYIDSETTSSATTGVTTVTNVSGLVITTPTQVAGRVLKWTIQGHIQNGSTADTAAVALWSGTSGGAVLASSTNAGPSIWAYPVYFNYLETTTAAALSRRVRISRGDGTSSTVAFYADSNRLGLLFCEDIGPASTTPPSV
jgi:hypothetical protein